MSRPKSNPATNQLLQVVGPALIILMVVSVVWFLIEVFYRGPHNARLCWIFGLFSAAAVLVSRISVESGRERSYLFAVPLAGATIFVAAGLIEGGFFWLPMLVAFVLFVLWATDRLTWDCTVIDRSRDASAVGLMELARRKLGWRKGGKEKEKSEHDYEHEHEHEEEKAKDIGWAEIDAGSDAQAGNLVLALLGIKKGRNTPGLWTMGFAGVALLVFGFGQLFVIRDGEWGFAWVALLFGVFLGSTIALLTLTSLLGLERYLQGRQLELPPGLSRRWMTVGLTLASLVATVTFLVPKPDLSGRLESAAAWLTSRSRDPSDLALGRDGVNQGNQARSTTNAGTQGQPADNKAPANAPHHEGQPDPANSGQPAGAQQPSSQSGGSQSGGSQSGGSQSGGSQSGGSQSGGSQSGGSQSGGSQSGGSQSGGSQSGGSQSGGSQSGGSQSGGSQSGQSGQQSPSQPSADQSPENNPAPQNESGQSSRPPAAQTDKNNSATQQPSGGEKPLNERQDPPDPDSSRNNRQEQSDRGNQAAAPSPAPNDPARVRPQETAQPGENSQGTSGLSRAASSFVKWITLLTGIIALLIAAWLFRDEIRGFLRELQAWWESLFARKGQSGYDHRTATAPSAARTRTSFLALSNPFRDGRHKRLPPAELARESFEALETLADELGGGRTEDSTPHEFAEAVATRHTRLAIAARQLAAVYNAAAYGSGQLTSNQLGQLRESWQAMEQFAASGLSGPLHSAG